MAGMGCVGGGICWGRIRPPVEGMRMRLTTAVLAKPRTLTDASYDSGWFARLQPTNFQEDGRSLRSAKDAHDGLTKQIATLRVRCFAAFPDHEMFEIGIECSAVLAKLNELLTRIDVGGVVHLVTDDPTSPIEMVRWSDQTGQPVIDQRKEGNLFHFLVRKVSDRTGADP